MEGDGVANKVGNRSANSNHPIQENDKVQRSSIKLAHSNINSIRNKLDDIDNELSDYDIICISETKLNNSIQTTNLMLNTYNTPIRKDRDINTGGGLIFTLKITFSSKEGMT